MTLCPPEELAELAVPQLDAGDADAAATPRAVPLPPAYAAAQAAKMAAVADLAARLRGGAVPPEHAAAFAGWVEAQFAEWLRATGQARPLRELANLAAAQ